MFLMWIFQVAMNYFDSFSSLLYVQMVELGSIPTFVADFLFDAFELALFFVPVSTFPIFVLVPLIWAHRIVVAIVSEFFGSIRKIPIIAKFLYG